MAKLAKRTRVSGHGGAGPFHLPQKPGRVNHFTDTRARKPLRAVPTVANLDAVLQFLERTRERRSIFRRAADKLRGRQAA